MFETSWLVDEYVWILRGSKRSSPPILFGKKRDFKLWNLDKWWTPGNFGNLTIGKIKCSRSPKYESTSNVLLNQKCVRRTIDFLMNKFEIFVSSNLVKKRIIQWWNLDKSPNPRIY